MINACLAIGLGAMLSESLEIDWLVRNFVTGNQTRNKGNKVQRKGEANAGRRWILEGRERKVVRAVSALWSVSTAITAGHSLLVNATHSSLCNETASNGYTLLMRHHNFSEQQEAKKKQEINIRLHDDCNKIHFLWMNVNKTPINLVRTVD